MRTRIDREPPVSALPVAVEPRKPADRTASRRWVRLAPAVTLVVLSPLLAEVLLGATPLSNLGALLPELGAYGCGALLIRDLVRRRGLGWTSIVILGLAFGLIEEGLALVSLFNPDLFNAASYGGRVLGINLVWTQWTLGYHIVWSVSIPILLTELLFPEHRQRPWLGRTGIAVAGIFYLLGILSFALIFHFIIAPDFVAPPVGMAGTALLVAGLISTGLRSASRRANSASVEVSVPAPWIVGLMAFVSAVAWFTLIGPLPETLRTGLWPAILMLLAAAPTAVTAILIRRWSKSQRRWTDSHRLALALGPLTMSMLSGFFFVTAGNPIDRAGQGVISIVALILLGLFALRVRRRALATEAPGAPR